MTDEAKISRINEIIEASSYTKLEELAKGRWAYFVISHEPVEQTSEAWFFKDFSESQLFVEGSDHEHTIYQLLRLELIVKVMSNE